MTGLGVLGLVTLLTLALPLKMDNFCVREKWYPWRPDFVGLQLHHTAQQSPAQVTIILSLPFQLLLLSFLSFPFQYAESIIFERFFLKGKLVGLGWLRSKYNQIFQLFRFWPLTILSLSFCLFLLDGRQLFEEQLSQSNSFRKHINKMNFSL